MIKLSIIIPVYNTPEVLLEQCISSVEQNLYNMNEETEVLFINDGSTEPHVEQILKHIENKNPRIKYIFKPNSGVANTRNMGINIAQGEYLTFVDADDYLEPDAFQYMLDTIETVKTDVVMFGFSDDNDNKSRVEVKRYYSGSDKDEIIWALVSGKTWQYTLSGYLISTVWANIYRREFLIKNKIFFVQDVAPNEDFLFMIYLLHKVDAFYVDNRLVYHYVYYADSAVRKFTNRHISVAINMMPILDDFVFCNYPGNTRFMEAVVLRAYSYIRFNKGIYFTHPQNTKSFWKLKSEMDDFLSNPVISKWLKQLKLFGAEDKIDFRNRLLLKLHLYWLFLLTERRKRIARER